MDDKIAQLILDELFSSLETLETETAAVLQFLKDKTGASGEQLAPYLEQAGKASSIKRRAARVRIDYLISGIANPLKKAVEQDAANGEKKSPEPTPEKPKEKAEKKDKEEEDKEDKEDKSDDQKEKPEGKTEGKTEDSKGQERREERPGKDKGEQEKRSAGPASEEEKKNKPAQPTETDQKTGNKKKNGKESGKEPAAKSPIRR